MVILCTFTFYTFPCIFQVIMLDFVCSVSWWTTSWRCWDQMQMEEQYDLCLLLKSWNVSSIYILHISYVDRFKSNQTFKFSPFLDILCLNEGNLKRVNRCALKFYTLKIESVSYMRVGSKIAISCHLCVLLRVGSKAKLLHCFKVNMTQPNIKHRLKTQREEN